jgi:S-formylglutathione hydrolase FrmB
MESERKEPKTPRTALKGTEENYTQPTGKQTADDRTLNQGKDCPPQAKAAAQKASWRATAHKRGTHDPESAREALSDPGGH